LIVTEQTAQGVDRDAAVRRDSPGSVLVGPDEVVDRIQEADGGSPDESPLLGT